MDQIDAAISAAEQGVEQVPVPSQAFKIFSGILKTSKGVDGKRRLKGVASSTTKDLHGDTMLSSALEDMERAAGNNLTIFLNHSYNVPEDVAGSVEVAKMAPRGVDGDGNPNFDLDFEIVINEANPRAVKAWESMDSGVKLGLSIGALIPEGGAVRDKKAGTYTIAHVQLLETSIVGIPANPRSWIQNAVKALGASLAKAQQTVDLGTPTLTLDGSRYHIEGELEGLQLGTRSAIKDGEPAQAGDPASGAAPEVDAEKAKIRIIEVDTDSPESGDGSSQGASSSEPGDEGITDSAAPSGDSAAAAATVATVTAGLDPAVRQSFQGVLDILEATVRDLVATKGLLRQANEAKEAAERDRGDTADAARLLFRQVHDILEQLADTPVGRKASFRQAKADFSHLEGLYSESFLRLLRS